MRARVRPGYRLVVIDLSSCGALVEAGRPLRPGSHVDVHLETDDRHGTVSARVVRCAVATIDAERGVTYHAALAFNSCCEWVRELVTLNGYGFPAQGSAPAALTSDRGDGLPPMRGECAEPPLKGRK
jgi:hypothetical protein